jgi:DNA primase
LADGAQPRLVHVVTPLTNEAGKLGWTEAKEFARLVCMQMAADARVELRVIELRNIISFAAA